MFLFEVTFLPRFRKMFFEVETIDVSHRYFCVFLFLCDVHLLQLQAQTLFYPIGMSTEHSALLAVGVA